MSDVGELELLYDNCKDLLTHFQFLIDSPLVSFYTEEHWKYIEDLGWSDYLLDLTDDELVLLPNPSQLSLSDKTPQSLRKFVTNCSEIYSFFPKLDTELTEGFVKLGMSPKKQHEVFVMGNTVKSILRSEMCDVSQIIDFGSGKGYLPEHIALTSPSVRVVGLDKDQVNTHGGLQRNKLMERLWLPLFRKHNEQRVECSTAQTNHYFPLTLELTSDHISETFVKDISGLTSEFITESNTMLIGLHSCGDLTSLLLQTFLQCSSLKSIVSVGCCYHLITQKERTKSFMIEGPHKEKLCDPGSVHAYPMSTYIDKAPLYFTRNALNLASQAPERMASRKSMPPENLFFRAVFQVLLQNEFEKYPACNVGHSASLASDFQTYCKLAFQKLRFGNDLTPELIESYIQRYSTGCCRRKVFVFHQLRTLLTRVIECVFLVDRLLFLSDRGVKGSVSRLFDPIQSPRCYVLIANKS